MIVAIMSNCPWYVFNGLFLYKYKERNISCTRSIKTINVVADLKHSSEVQLSVGKKA